MKAERVVLDASALISAALRRDGRPRAVVDAVRGERGVLLFSDETFDEFRILRSFHFPTLFSSKMSALSKPPRAACSSPPVTH